MESVLVNALDLESFFQVTKGNIQSIFLVGILIFGLLLAVVLLIKVFLRTVMGFFNPSSIDVSSMTDAGAKESLMTKGGR